MKKLALHSSKPSALSMAICLAMGTNVADMAWATTHPVTACSDVARLPTCDGVEDGTLRKAYFCAQDGDKIDLTNLSCSTITLAAPLTGGAPNMTVYSNGDSKTISGGNRFRAFVHTGTLTGTLNIGHVNVTAGFYENPYASSHGGGCIYSSANVKLEAAVISDCTVVARRGIATGGGIFAAGKVRAYGSSIVDNGAHGYFASRYTANAKGGGIYSNSVYLMGSEVSGNIAQNFNSSSTQYGEGGGINTYNFESKSSTISNNAAQSSGGVYAANSATVINSTVSGNVASDSGIGGVFTWGSAQVYNSTIAFNQGFRIGGLGADTLTMRSSIFSNNTGTAPEGCSVFPNGDTSMGVNCDVAFDTVSGSSNVVMSKLSGRGNALPLDTIAIDPQLKQLSLNGSKNITKTHALSGNSPAIDKGDNLLNLENDERGADFRRVVGGRADVGAFELDRIFGNRFEK